MTVGPAGTVNTTLHRKPTGAVSPMQVTELKEAVNHSTASSNASGMQLSQGYHRSEHSQDTSSYSPSFLRPGRRSTLAPGRRQGAPLYRTQGVAATPAQRRRRVADGDVEVRDARHHRRRARSEYDAGKWDNDEGSYKVEFKEPDRRHPARQPGTERGHKALHQEGSTARRPT